MNTEDSTHLSFLSELSMPSVLYQASYCRAYNVWLDTAADFRRSFEDDTDEAGTQAYNIVINVVLNCLTRNLDKPADDPAHPFNRYADIDKSGPENFAALAADVRAEIQSPYLRGLVTSMFHSGGPCYGDTLNLLNNYLKFADRAEDPDYATQGDDDDDDDEDEEDMSQNEPAGQDDEVSVSSQDGA